MSCYKYMGAADFSPKSLFIPAGIAMFFPFPKCTCHHHHHSSSLSQGANWTQKLDRYRKKITKSHTVKSRNFFPAPSFDSLILLLQFNLTRVKSCSASLQKCSVYHLFLFYTHGIIKCNEFFFGFWWGGVGFCFLFFAFQHPILLSSG